VQGVHVSRPPSATLDLAARTTVLMLSRRQVQRLVTSDLLLHDHQPLVFVQDSSLPTLCRTPRPMLRLQAAQWHRSHSVPRQTPGGSLSGNSNNCPYSTHSPALVWSCYWLHSIYFDPTQCPDTLTLPVW
jgi:hypothetical protein